MQAGKNLYPFECLLLSGMPCTGKDTLSQKLIERDASFMLLKKHRAVATPQTRASDTAYLDISPEEFQAMAHSGEFLQYHSRYGKMYGVSRAAYQTIVDSSHIPIIHVGKYENLHALRKEGLQQGLSLLLWADRHIVQARLQERHAYRSDSAEERIVAYDEEVAQLKKFGSQAMLDFDLLFVNNGTDREQAADHLLASLRSSGTHPKEETHLHIMELLALSDQHLMTR